VREEVWVKEALLYWDKVATIVPLDVDPASFRSHLYRTLADRDVIEAWPVSGWVRDEAASRILDLLDSQAHIQLPDGPPFRLNFGKVSQELVRGLTERAFEIKAKGSDVEVEFRVGALVMCILAQQVGERAKSRAVTDDSDLGAAYVSVLGSPERARQLGEIISRDVSVAVPDVRNVDLEKWLDFRSRNQDELRVYRASLNSLAREMAGAEDASEADSVLERRQQELEEFMNRGFLRKLTADRTLSGLSLIVGLPSLFVDPALGFSVITGGISTAITVKQLAHREVHALTFVHSLHRKFG
jgi:hypothetical protein